MFLNVIRNIKNKIALAYQACANKGANIPSKTDLGNLANTINSIVIPTFKTQEKTVTTNGVITPDAGFDGLSKVSVDVISLSENSLTKLNEMVGE